MVVLPAPGPLDLAPVRALLLDMDGTLVDSHRSVERSWRIWAERYGVDPEAVVAVCHGATGDETMRRFRPDLDDETIAAENAAHLAQETGDVSDVVAAAGAVDLLETCARFDVPWAVVTNADTPLARARLGAAGFDPVHLVSAQWTTWRSASRIRRAIGSGRNASGCRSRTASWSRTVVPVWRRGGRPGRGSPCFIGMTVNCA